MSASPPTTETSRRLRDTLEPVIGQVYFSPECHEEYIALGFDPSPATVGGVALPDGAAYFTSRGSVMGQVPGEVVAAAFAVFNPAVVVPMVDLGWSRTDAPTIAMARHRGAVAQLRRVLGDAPDGLDAVVTVLERTIASLHPAGRPLFAGLLSLDPPDDAWGRFFRVGDLLREYRGDCHTAAWTAAGLSPIEIGLLSELSWGLSMGTYIRTRAWSDAEVDAAKANLLSRGHIDEHGGFTDGGREVRESIEQATDRQLAPVIDALGADADLVFDTVGPWSVAMVESGGYLRSAGQLTSS